MKKILYLFLFFAAIQTADAQTIYSYTTATSGAPATVSPNLTGSSLTRVNGATAPGSACATGFSSSNFQSSGAYSTTQGAVNVDLTPAAGYGISITGFSVGVRRSGTGPASVRLAYSTDGGVTWIAKPTDDAPNNAGCGSMATATWTTAVSASGVIKFRVYAFGASGTGGTFQIQNFNITGSVTLSGPEINSPIVTQIQPNSARLGATITSDGGTTITSRGIVWSTSPAPTVGSGGVTQINVAGAVGVYDTLVAGLPAGTRIYFRGFATNSNGTTYTADGSFYTLSTEPAGAVTGLTATALSEHDIKLNWTPVANADGYVVIQRMDSTITSFPADANRYNEGNMIGTGEVVDTILSGNESTRTYGGLISGTVYFYSVIPYRFNGTNAETFNYFTDPVVPVANDTTLGMPPSRVSDIIGIQSSEAVQVLAIINDTLNTDTNGVQVWKLSLRDGGGSNDQDFLPTSINRMVITKGANNSAVWLNTLRFAALFDDSTGLKIADAGIYNDSLVFPSISITASDNSYKNFSLRISLKPSNIRDNDTLHFTLSKNNVRSEWLNFSSQLAGFNIKTDSSLNRVEVKATRIVITQQPPANIRVNTIINPPVRVELVDANGNKDLNHAAPVIAAGTISPATNEPLVKPGTLGVVVYDSLSFPGIAGNNRIKIFSTGLDTVYTTTFSIFGSNQSDIVSTNGFVYTDSIPYLDYQEPTALTATNSAAVFSVTMRDGGVNMNDADTFGTVLSSITFQVTNNQYIRHAALFKGNTRIAEKAVNSSTLVFDTIAIRANDNDSTVLTLRVSFNSRYANAQRISFTVTNVSADTSKGSVFGLINAGGAASSVAGANNVLKYVPVYVTPPTVFDAIICKGSDASLTASKTFNSLTRWYYNPTDETPFFTGDTLKLTAVNSSISFYASTDSAGWASARAEVKAVVITVSDPSVNTVNICRGNTASFTAVSVNPVQWYNTFLTTSPLSSSNNFTTGLIRNDTVFYVQADSAGCKSNRVAAPVNITKVTPPAVVRDTNICANTSLTLHALSSHNITWYVPNVPSPAPVGSGAFFNAGNIAKDTVFYASADSSGCSSELLAIRVRATLINKPSVTFDSTAVCAGNTVLLSSNDARKIKWYDLPVAGTLLDSNHSFTTPVLTVNTTYYAEATQNNCLSQRTAVKITVNEAPPVPVVSGDSACSGSAVTLGATSGSAIIKWFDASIGGNLLYTGNQFTTPAITTPATYYAQAEAMGCTSAFKSVTVSVKNKPAMPNTVTTNACSGKPVKLTVTNKLGTLKWFSNISDTVETASGDTFTTPALLQNKTYYVSNFVNGCASEKRSLNVIVNATPDATFTVNQPEQCLYNNQFVFANAFNPAGTQYQWNFGDSSTIGLPNPVKTFNKTGSFTVKLKITSNKGCIAESQTIVKTEAPAVDFTYSGTARTVQFATSLTNIVSYKWYFTSTDSAETANPSFTFGAGGTYLVRLTVTDNKGCVNTISKTVVVSTTGVAEELAAQYRYKLFPNPVKDQLAVRYELPRTAAVNIRLFDMQGRLVKELLNEEQFAGDREMMFDLSEIQSSVYFITTTINGVQQTTKLIKQ